MTYRKKRSFEYNGVIYKSNYEKKQAEWLTKHNIKFEYEPHSLDYMDSVYNAHCEDCGSQNVCSVRSYTPDFYLPDTGIYVETKGKLDAPTRTKMQQVCNQRQEDIRIVFMRDNWLTRKHKMNYSRWCELKGITFAVGNIPLEWGKKK